MIGTGFVSISFVSTYFVRTGFVKTGSVVLGNRRFLSKLADSGNSRQAQP
jgi:hypothetical protein